MSISLPLLLVAFLQPPLHAVAPRAPSRTAVPTCAAGDRPNFALKLGTSVAGSILSHSLTIVFQSVAPFFSSLFLSFIVVSL